MHHHMACDDLKISNAEKKVIGDINARLNNKFGKESRFTTTHGKVLEYLGMMLDYSTMGKVKISCMNKSTKCKARYLLT